MVSGTLGQWGAGLYSLVCDTTAWLWAHGGAIYGPDGHSALMDARATAALEYMLELRGLMPPEALRWDWWDASEALLQGRAGMALFWNALLPALDDPFESKVAGLIDVAPCPAGFAPRSAGFGEMPGIGRHGGSLLALANTSRNQEAAWIFMQWASSPAVLERACRISGATPIRRSTYTALQAQPGAPRHLNATFDTITRRLGTEPRLPAWPTLAVDHLAVEMGRLLAGEQSVRSTQEHMACAAEALA
jgi:multiple sugar transport system substrate-binding protein